MREKGEGGTTREVTREGSSIFLPDVSYHKSGTWMSLGYFFQKRRLTTDASSFKVKVSTMVWKNVLW
jgi:hypothetical protein